MKRDVCPSRDCAGLIASTPGPFVLRSVSPPDTEIAQPADEVAELVRPVAPAIPGLARTGGRPVPGRAAGVGRAPLDNPVALPITGFATIPFCAVTTFVAATEFEGGIPFPGLMTTGFETCGTGRLGTTK